MVPFSLPNHPFVYIEHGKTLSPEDRHHLIKVLRLKPEDPLWISDGKGHIWEGYLLDGKGNIVKGKRLITYSPSPIHLACAPPKGYRMSFLVEKAGELGIRSFIPLLAQYNSVKGITEGMLNRWKRLLKAAGKQAKRAWLPTVQEPKTVEAVLSLPLPKGVLMPQGDRQAWDKVRTWEEGVLLVGPEGGWSEEEYQAFQKKDILALPLGDTLLRTETAAIAALVLAKGL